MRASHKTDEHKLVFQNKWWSLLLLFWSVWCMMNGTPVGTWNKMGLSVGQIISCSAGWLCVQEICFSDASLGLQKQKQTNKKRWASRGGFLWSRRLWQREEKSSLAFTNSVLPSLKASVSFPKIFWEKPLGKRVALSQKVTWEQFPVCLFCQLSSCKILPCTQRRLWSSAVLNNL